MVDAKVYVINLGRLYWSGRSARASRAMKTIRKYLERHLKTDNIILDESINEYVFSRSYDKPPRRVAVRVYPVDKEGKVFKATLAIPLEEEKPAETQETQE